MSAKKKTVSKFAKWGKKGGRVSSDAKAAAAAANGHLGGRPRKIIPVDLNSPEAKKIVLAVGLKNRPAVVETKTRLNAAFGKLGKPAARVSK